MQHPPAYVLVENVVGFESSPIRLQLHDALASIGLSMQVTANFVASHNTKVQVSCSCSVCAQVCRGSTIVMVSAGVFGNPVAAGDPIFPAALLCAGAAEAR